MEYLYIYVGLFSAVMYNFQWASLGILIKSIPKYLTNVDIFERELPFQIINCYCMQIKLCYHLFLSVWTTLSLKLLVRIQHYIIRLLSLFLFWLLRTASIGSCFHLPYLCGFFCFVFLYCLIL